MWANTEPARPGVEEGGVGGPPPCRKQPSPKHPVVFPSFLTQISTNVHDGRDEDSKLKRSRGAGGESRRPGFESLLGHVLPEDYLGRLPSFPVRLIRL